MNARTLDHANPLLEVRDLEVEFETDAGVVRALDGVDFTIGAGEVVGLVGESGSGKSVTALAVLGLLPRSARRRGGSIVHRGRELERMSPRELRALSGREIALVFQDPSAALDPLMRVGAQIAEGLVVHALCDRTAAAARAIDWLERLGFEDSRRSARSFPHELSGGMRQRAALAAALACEPGLILADEVTTALDAALAVRIRELVRDLVRERAASWLWITHDLSSARSLCDRVLVMNAGRVVESAPSRELFAAPRHPYTQALLRSDLALAAPRAKLDVIEGLPPSAFERPSGCGFRTRCPLAIDLCAAKAPAFEHVSDRHRAACHRIEETRP